MDYNLDEMSDNRVMCLFMKICERLYNFAALDEEGKPVDRMEVLKWAGMYGEVRKEISSRGLLDNAFNLN